MAKFTIALASNSATTIASIIGIPVTGLKEPSQIPEPYATSSSITAHARVYAFRQRTPKSHD